MIVTVRREGRGMRRREGGRGGGKGDEEEGRGTRRREGDEEEGRGTRRGNLAECSDACTYELQLYAFLF